ncbi:MAG: phytoene desaturase family protein [Caldisericaceae bacterium]
MVWDVIVVGGGIAGLTAAAYAARSGANVLVLEKNKKCGGLVNSIERDGFVFDGGVRALENAGIILPMLRDLGIRLEFVKSPVSVGVEDKIIKINSKESLKDYESLLKQLYPESIEDVNEVARLIKGIMREMEVLYGIDNPLFLVLKRDLKKFLPYGPWFFRFLKTVYAMGKMNEPIEPFLERKLKNSSLKDIISQHFFKGTPAFFAMSYFYLYTDYIYPKGGVGRLSEAVENKALELGAKIYTSKRVLEVIPHRNVIKDDDGNAYEYKKLIWAADLKTLYYIIKNDGLGDKILTKFDGEKERILKGFGADSIFTVFAGVDESPEKFSEVAQGHFFYTPSRKGLGEIRRSELTNLLNNWEKVSKKDVFNWLEKLSSFETYEISIPALRDSSTVPPGKTGLIASFLFDYDLVKKVNESGWYEEFKEQLGKYMIKTLSRTLYHGLEDKLLFSFTATPLTIERYVGSSEGSIVGWSFEEALPVSSSMLSVRNSVKTAIPNILKAGQWSYSPTGVPTCIMTGRLAADAAIEK